MGEYAIRKSDGIEVKIGTCESMYYLRADQRSQVRHLENNVDPEGDADAIRFRFPFPDEDTVQPGDFTNHDRGVEVPDMHYDALGISSITCPHRTGCTATRGVAVVQQRLVTGQLLVVCRCVECGTLFRLPTLEDAAPIVRGFFAEVRHAIAAKDFKAADFALAMAERVLEGYTVGG